MHLCVNCGVEFKSPTGPTCPHCTSPLLLVPSIQDNLIGKTLEGKYRLLELLGRGGMGAVFKATQLNLDSTVAIKVMRLEVGDEATALRRFYAEAKNSSKLRHPHNVRVFDFGHTQEGLAFIAMELVDGLPLSRVPKPMAIPRALKIVRQVCGALSEAHSIGLIHRDIKPDNIILSDIDGDDFARVLDYGIAKMVDNETNLTRSSTVLGTPRYLSPEHVTLGMQLDGRSDIYSLAMVLYQLLTGRLPFMSEDALELAYSQKHSAPPPPSDFVELPDEVDLLVLRCLEKDRDHRPADTGELRDLIDEVLRRLPGGAAESAAGSGAAPLIDTGSTSKIRTEPTVNSLTPTGPRPPSPHPSERPKSEPSPSSLDETDKRPPLNPGSRRGLLAGFTVAAAAIALVAVFGLNGPGPDTGNSDPADLGTVSDEQATEVDTTGTQNDSSTGIESARAEGTGQPALSSPAGEDAEVVTAVAPSEAQNSHQPTADVESENTDSDVGARPQRRERVATQPANPDQGTAEQQQEEAAEAPEAESEADSLRDQLRRRTGALLPEQSEEEDPEGE